MSLTERRLSRRIRYRSQIEYFVWNDRKTARTTDISASGLFLATEELLPLGAMLTLRLTVPGSPRPFTVLGRVSRVVLGGKGFDTGLGIRFLDISPDRADLIASFAGAHASA